MGQAKEKDGKVTIVINTSTKSKNKNLDDCISSEQKESMEEALLSTLPKKTKKALKTLRVDLNKFNNLNDLIALPFLEEFKELQKGLNILSEPYKKAQEAINAFQSPAIRELAETLNSNKIPSLNIMNAGIKDLKGIDYKNFGGFKPPSI